MRRLQPEKLVMANNGKTPEASGVMLRTQILVILEVLFDSNFITVSELSFKTNVGEVNVRRWLDELEARQWVEKYRINKKDQYRLSPRALLREHRFVLERIKNMTKGD